MKCCFVGLERLLSSSRSFSLVRNSQSALVRAFLISGAYWVRGAPQALCVLKSGSRT